MNRILVLAMTVSMALLVGGCGGSSSGAASTPSASGGKLDGTSWQLSAYAAAGATSMTSVPANVRATAVFTADRVAGSGGCNSYSGPYTTSRATIHIGPLASTQMACMGAAGVVEALYLKGLEAAAGYTVTAAELTLTGADGKPMLSFAAAKAPSLVGTNWTATQINNGKQGVESIVAGTTVTAVFATDGTVSGSGGCNTYNGSYTVNGAALTFGAISSTQKACAADVSTQEAAYLAALSRTTTYLIQNDHLELRDASGALQVAYSGVAG